MADNLRIVPVPLNIGRSVRQVFGANLSPLSYQSLLRFTIQTTESLTGASTRTPMTVARAAPELKPKGAIAAATMICSPWKRRDFAALLA